MLTLTRAHRLSRCSQLRQLASELGLESPAPSLNSKRTHLLKLFDELGKTDFPGSRRQFKNRYAGTVRLDTEIMKILGFSQDEIKKILPNLYDMLYEEMTDQEAEERLAPQVILF